MKNGVKLSPKKSHGYISSYNLSISLREANTLKFIDNIKSETGFVHTVSFIVTKQIVDNKLVISRAFPQTRSRYNAYFTRL